MKLSECVAELAEEARKRGFRRDEAVLLEAAALARRVEVAPTGEVWQHACIGGQRTSNIIITREPEDGLAVIGKRVRIVEE